MIITLYSYYAEPPMDVEFDLSDIHLEIAEYSEKSIVVTGDTKLLRTQLKKMGGKFNRNLKCGAGWIFSKKVKDDVEHLVSLVNQIDKIEEE